VNRLRWGILSTGNIARQFAKGLKESQSGELVAVSSRSLEKAAAFCAEHGGKPYGSRDELLADPEIDAVYIATPHHTHAEDTIAAARAGKGILCEKPFTLNSEQAEAAIAAVRDAGVFFMEAFMYRCTPQTHRIREWLEAEVIGEPRLVQATFCFQAKEDWDNFRNDPAVGGGGLMDVGCYCVSFCRLAFGEVPSEAHYISKPNSKGVDWTASGLLRFSENRSAVFQCGVGIHARNDAVIYGERGRIEVESPWKNWENSKLHRYEGQELVESLSLGVSNAQLYAIEADAVAQYWEAKECPHVTIEDTLAQMRTLDRLRDAAGIRFAVAEDSLAGTLNPGIT